ncbi:MAG TPA: hypothetical protein VMU05_14235, partial [Dongiaceae bacterium]|nr:hypothetical protein [Dongiaceae bacterium]
IDRDTVHNTSINGPQWFEEDFEEEENAEEVEECDEIDDNDVASDDVDKAPAASAQENTHAARQPQPAAQATQLVSQVARKEVQGARPKLSAVAADAG